MNQIGSDLGFYNPRITDAAMTSSGDSYYAAIGDGISKVFTIAQEKHGRRGDIANLVEVRETATGDRAFPSISVNPDDGEVTISFEPDIPTLNEFTVIVF